MSRTKKILSSLTQPPTWDVINMKYVQPCLLSFQRFVDFHSRDCCAGAYLWCSGTRSSSAMNLLVSPVPLCRESLQDFSIARQEMCANINLMWLHTEASHTFFGGSKICVFNIRRRAYFATDSMTNDFIKKSSSVRGRMTINPRLEWYFSSSLWLSA